MLVSYRTRGRLVLPTADDYFMVTNLRYWLVRLKELSNRSTEIL